MSKKNSRALVVDACVLRSAGMSDHPTSSASRKALKDILDICHRVIVTDPIRAEWNKHSSGYSRAWQASMTAKKKIIRMKNLSACKINMHGLTDSQRSSIAKDRHLLDAACATEGFIITLDTTLEDLMGSREFLLQVHTPPRAPAGVWGQASS